MVHFHNEKLEHYKLWNRGSAFIRELVESFVVRYKGFSITPQEYIPGSSLHGWDLSKLKISELKQWG